MTGDGGEPAPVPWWQHPRWLWRINNQAVSYFKGVFWPSPSKPTSEYPHPDREHARPQDGLPWELRDEQH